MHVVTLDSVIEEHGPDRVAAVLRHWERLRPALDSDTKCVGRIQAHLPKMRADSIRNILHVHGIICERPDVRYVRPGRSGKRPRETDDEMICRLWEKYANRTGCDRVNSVAAHMRSNRGPKWRTALVRERLFANGFSPAVPDQKAHLDAIRRKGQEMRRLRKESEAAPPPRRAKVGKEKLPKIAPPASPRPSKRAPEVSRETIQVPETRETSSVSEYVEPVEAPHNMTAISREPEYVPILKPWNRRYSVDVALTAVKAFLSGKTTAHVWRMGGMELADAHQLAGLAKGMTPAEYKELAVKWRAMEKLARENS